MDSSQLPALLNGATGPAAFAAAIGAAFVMGAVHALSPGHGKTLVAAYLAGSRGTLRHALLLGATVTFTHTVSVFGLGFAALFLTEYIMPQQIASTLAVVSGVAIIAIGVHLLRKRWHVARHHHGHAHHHHHHGHHHHGDGHDHHHHHAPPEEISMGSLLALGASGGLVPCPSALVLMLSAISLGRVALGMTLLVSFSLGLAAVLIAIGAAVLYGAAFIPRELPKMRWVPVISAVFVTAVGVAMTGAALVSR